MICKNPFGVSLRNLAVVCFQNNLASIRSFEGYNVAWFTVIETKDIRLKMYLYPPHLRDVLQSYAQLTQTIALCFKNLDVVDSSGINEVL